MTEFHFSINVYLQGEDDPERAIQWFMEHLSVSVQSGELVVRGTGPDGTTYLWRPEPGKSPAEWLVNSTPPDAADA